MHAAESYLSHPNDKSIAHQSDPPRESASRLAKNQTKALSQDTRSAIIDIARTTRATNWPPAKLSDWCDHLFRNVVQLENHKPPLIRLVPSRQPDESSLSPQEIGELPLHEEGFTKAWHAQKSGLDSLGLEEMERWHDLLHATIDTNAVFLGGWSDPDNGQYEINLTIVLEYPEARRLARRLGELWDQKSIWIGLSADKGKEIPTGGNNSARWPLQSN